MVFDRKAYMKDYNSNPKRIAYLKKRNITPEARAQRKACASTLKGKASIKKYKQSELGKVSIAKANKKWRLKNRHKVNAKAKAGRYIKQKKSCEVKNCNEVGVKHHENYNKPLEVNWLCLKHHGVFHHSNDLPLEEFLRKEAKT